MSSPYESLNKDSKWIKILEGGSYQGKYLGWEEGEKFRGARTLNYIFDGGKVLNSSSKRLAMKMNNIPEGTVICIKKFGKGMETTFEVEVVGVKNQINVISSSIGGGWDDQV